MGPRPFGRGRRPWRPTRTRRGRPLQWGRDLSVAEGTPPRGTATAFPRLQWGRDLSVAEGSSGEPSDRIPSASMGPRPFGRGRVDADTWAWIADAASMGPRPFGRGRPGAQTALVDMKGHASMGPRPFGRGRPQAPPRGLESLASFNGAATFRSRKAEHRVARWDCVGFRFNGAATFRSRKVAAVATKSAPQPASMGPRPFGRGRSVGFHLYVKGTSFASMGPRPFGRGRKYTMRLCQSCIA